MKDEKPPAPTLGLTPKGADDEEGGEVEGDGGGGGGEAAAPTVNLADLIPRNDIRYITVLLCLGTLLTVLLCLVFGFFFLA